MTLIEVLGGLALLATLLVAILLLKAQATRQAGAAQRRLEALAAADRLLGQWWSNWDHLPRSGQGKLGEQTQMSWRTTLVSSEPARKLDLQVVRLEILEDRPADAGQLVLASVEVAVTMGKQ